MTLDRLIVEVEANTGNSRAQIDTLKRALKQAADEVENLKTQMRQLDAIGVSPENSQSYRSMIDQLVKAEDQMYRINDALEQVDDTTGETTQEMSKFGDETEKAQKRSMSAIQRTAARMFSLYKIIGMVRRSLDEYMEANKSSEMTEAVESVKESWKDVTTQLFDSLGPIVSEVSPAIIEMVEGLRDVNAVIGLVGHTLKDSGLMEAIDWLLTAPIKASNWILEWSAGMAGVTLNTTKIIKANIKDITKYQRLLNKETKTYRQLIAGFDELNIYSKEQNTNLDEEAEKKEAINELNEQILEYEKMYQKAAQENEATWKKYADTLGITTDEYKELWDVYNTGDLEAFKNKTEELGINWVKAANSMLDFKNNGLPAIQANEEAMQTYADAIREAKNLIIELGGEIRNLPVPSVQPSTGNAIDKAASKQNNNKMRDSLIGLGAGLLTGLGPIGGIAGYFLSDYLPWNANGGVYTTPSIVGVGEYSGASNNPEIIAPQSMIQDAVLNANGQLASVMAQVGNNIVTAVNNQSMEVTIGDDVIARSAARGNKNYYKQTGGYLI